MTPEQQSLMVQVRESIAAAKLLHEQGFHAFAASRAYYGMFYAAEAILLEKGITSAKHGGVHSAFGEHFVKTGLVPREYHRYLLRGLEVRHAADDGKSKTVTPEEAAVQLSNAEKFAALADQIIGPALGAEDNHSDVESFGET